MRDIMGRFSIDKVDLLMVDVEGAELQVLNGFPWERTKPARIYCELHPYNWAMYGYTGKQMSQFLQRHNYRCIDMYFHEHIIFDGSSYIGPCLLLPR